MARPPIFDNPEDLEHAANTYFAECSCAERMPTVNGLALALGMTRETLLRYAEKDEFSDTVKVIRMRLEAEWEQRLAGPNATGTIFWLKNQGWKDSVQQEVTGNMVHRVERHIVRPKD